jgi:hypothetical protein
LYPTPQEAAAVTAAGLSFGPVPSGSVLTPLAASYTKLETPKAKAGEYKGAQVWDGAADTGNNAWVGMALAHFAAASGKACYAAAAHDLLVALTAGGSCQDSLGGFMGRPFGDPEFRLFYRSSEHNLDVFALARMLGNSSAQESARNFVQRMYGADSSCPVCYATGTAGDLVPDDEQIVYCNQELYKLNPIATDVQTWNQLSDVDPNVTRKAASLGHIIKPVLDGGMSEQDIDYIGGPGGEDSGSSEYFGLRFSSLGHGIQWENTAAGIMALADFESSHGSEALPGLSGAVSKMRFSLSRILTAYKTVPASILGGNDIASKSPGGNSFTPWTPGNRYPGGSSTGIEYSYKRYPHLASTAWTGMMLMYQWADGAYIDKSKNPYSPPPNGVPTVEQAAADTSCLRPLR